MNKVRNLIDDVENNARYYFGDRDFFFCIYGSHATGEQTDASDLDLFFATPEVKAQDIKTLAEWMIRFHVSHHLALDDEVPFGNKLVVSYDDLEAAVSLSGLEKVDGKFRVPPVIKEPFFLESLAVRYRLLFNALTSPHMTEGNDFLSFKMYKERAELALIELGSDLALGKEVRGVKDKVEALLKGPNGEEGEMFLGYKRNPATIRYLEEIFSKNLVA